MTSRARTNDWNGGLRSRFRCPILPLIVGGLFPTLSLFGQFISVSFSDPEGDHEGAIDLVGYVLTFDRFSGEYEMILEASEEAPFFGEFKINIHAFNGDLGTTAPDPSYVSNELNFFDFATPSRWLRLSGNSQRLIEWSPGDRVALSGPEPLGVPDRTVWFQSGIGVLGDQSPKDGIAVGESSQIEFATGFDPSPLTPGILNDQLVLPEDSIRERLDVFANDFSSARPPSALQIIGVSPRSLEGEIILENNELLYTPPPNFYGIESFVYLARDLAGGEDQGFVTIDVTPVNDPPLAVLDIVQVAEDSGTVRIHPLANDSIEPDRDEILRLISIGHPVGGLRLDGDVVEFTPEADVFGEFLVPYGIGDGNGGEAQGIIEITLTPVNDPPLARGEKFEINGRLPRHELDVLANDSIHPDEGEHLSLVSFDADAGLGDVRLENDRLILEPTGNFEGVGQIRYRISDGNGGESSAIATLTIILPNRDPLALEDSFAILEDEVSVLSLLDNDTSAPDEGEELMLLEVGASAVGAQLSIVDNRVRYQPLADFFGVDTFTYVIVDGRGGRAESVVTVRVENVNDPPTVVDETFDILEDAGRQRFDLLGNDRSFPDVNESLTLQSVEQLSGQGFVGIVDNQLELVSADDFFGIIEVGYLVADGGGGEASGTATIRVASVNDPPIATLDLLTFPMGVGLVELDVLANDHTGPDTGETLQIAAVFASQVRGGQVTHDGRVIRFEALEGYEGTESFRYAVSDGNGGQASALVVLTVISETLGPEARDDEVRVDEDGVVIVDVVANDEIDEGERGALTPEVTVPPASGEVRVVNQLIEYRPFPDFFGEDSFGYQIVYADGESSSARVEVIIVNQNDPPTAVDDEVLLAEDSPSSVLSLLENDRSDPDPEEVLRVTGVSSSKIGSVVRLVEGEVHYQAPPDFFGRDSFSYTVSDDRDGRASANVVIVIEPVNDPPVAVEDAVTVEHGSGLVIVDVLANDTLGPDEGEALELIAVSRGIAKARVSISDAKVHYEPAADFIGEDRVSYSVGDGNGGIAVGQLLISVVAVARPPIATPDVFEIAEDQVDVALDVLKNDESGAVGASSLEIVSLSSGSVSGVLRTDGSHIYYSPKSNFFGEERFSYRVTEGGFESADAQVLVRVISVNDPPRAVDDVYRFENPEGVIELDVLQNDLIQPDENETLTIVAVSSDFEGKLEWDEENLSYLVSSSEEGIETFSYTISDGGGLQATGEVTIEVVRHDRVAPVLQCRDAELVLDAEGRGILTVSMVDQGSFDESGMITLSVSPRQFGIGDVGINPVVLRGVDEAGNESECTALVTVVPRPIVSLELVRPGALEVFEADEVYDFVAADVPLEVSVEGGIQAIRIFGDGQLLHEISEPIDSDSFNWIWQEVIVGDHEIWVEATTHDEERVQSLPVVFSVSELGATVALVVPDGSDVDALGGIPKMLFEMGVNVRLILESQLADLDSRPYSLVIWDPQDRDEMTIELLEAFERLRMERVSLYFIEPPLRGRWVDETRDRRLADLLLLEPLEEVGTLDGRIELFTDVGFGILNGRFGRIEPFDLESVPEAEIHRADVERLIGLRGRDAMVRTSSDDADVSLRIVTQLFSVFDREADLRMMPRRVLFQNAVCWLLENCRDCQNANLPPVLRGAPMEVELEQPFLVELNVENNGACEITGAKLTLAGSGLRVDRLRVDNRSVPVEFDSDEGLWRGVIGRVGRGSVASRRIEWQLRARQSGANELVFGTVSNNTALSLVRVSVVAAGPSYTLSIVRENGLALVVQGSEGMNYRIEEADILDIETVWKPLPDGEGVLGGESALVPLNIDSGTAQRFYRVVDISPKEVP